MQSKQFKSSRRSVILGAAFLMATSAIGPGFLTQTAAFTEQLLASFGFVILTSILLDIGAQLNIWRILTVSEMRAQDVANRLMPGLGYLLGVLICAGGLAFNIGNIAGCSLGLQVLTGMQSEYAAVLSCILALWLFWSRDIGYALDLFVKVLGILMIVLTAYIALSSDPPIAEALFRSFVPEKIDFRAIITVVGGTVGGYISFAGAHRLLDAGVAGQKNLRQVNRSAVSGIIITGIMRAILFIAALAVISKGVSLDPNNPASTVFKSAAGEIGYRFFGAVMWCAAITSVIGASYTSISFIKTFHGELEKNQRLLISAFVIISTQIFISVGRPKELLINAGLVNGFILPLALSIILIAGGRTKVVGQFRNPLWLTLSGWAVVALLSAMAVMALLQ